MGKKLLKRGAAVILMLMVLSTGLVANAERTYTVEKGDHLKKIAQTVYGDPAGWKDIYEANKASIRNPDIIYKGQVLIIPDAGFAGEEASEKAMTLEQWTMSEECRLMEEGGNEVIKEAGVVFALKADGNTLVYEFTYSPEIWGGLTVEEMAVSLEDFDEFIEERWEDVEEICRDFDRTYDIKLDGMSYVFIAPDGTTAYRYDIALLNEQTVEDR